MRKRYMVYVTKNGRTSLVDDFGAKEAAKLVQKTVPCFLARIETYGSADGNGHRAIPFTPS